MKAIILAAGYATRLYPLTRNTAKPLLPVAGKPILEYIVDQIATIPAIDQLCIVSNHRFYAQFVEWNERYQRQKNLRSDLQTVVLDDGSTCQEDRLGAIGDIQFCIEKLALSDDLLVIAGDNLFTYQLKSLWHAFDENKQDMIVAKMMGKAEDLSRYAIAEIDAQGYVLSLEEKPQKPKSDIAVFATYFYRQDTLPLVKRYLDEGNPKDAPGHFPAWLYKIKPVRVYLFDGLCIDIGTPEAYEDVRTTFPGVHE